MPFWGRMYAELWEPLHGSPYYSGPKTDCLFNVLYQMGIYPDVEMMPLAKDTVLLREGVDRVLQPEVQCTNGGAAGNSEKVLRPQVREEERGYKLRKLHIRKNLVEKTVKKIF